MPSSPHKAASLGQRSESSNPDSSSPESVELASSDDGEIDEDGQEDRTKSEVLTINLAGVFGRYVLNFCAGVAGQNPEKKTMLEFREEPYRVSHQTAHLRINATDDGGIWVVETKQPGKSPWVWTRRVALLEAKRAFQSINGKSRRTVRDTHLLQYRCEALSACLDEPDRNEYIYTIFI